MQCGFNAIIKMHFYINFSPISSYYIVYPLTSPRIRHFTRLLLAQTITGMHNIPRALA